MNIILKYKKAIIAIVIFAGIILLIGIPNPRLFLYRSEKAIENYLFNKTPLGTKYDDVAVYLNSIGISSRAIFKTEISAGSDYPMSSVAAKGFIHECIGEYRIVFVTSVEAFYLFDVKDNLVDIKVRKTIDAL